jgi:MSHA biogenesis protein MshN
VAGFTGARLFSRGAIARLYRASGGMPRLVNILAHKALMLCYGEGKQQDLDARGGAGGDEVQQQELKAVPVAERDRRPLLMAGAGVAVIVLAFGGWYGWQWWQAQNRSAPPGPVPKVIDNRIPNRPRLQEPPAENASPASAPAATRSTAAGSASAAPAANAVSGNPAVAREHSDASPERKPARQPAVKTDSVAASPGAANGVTINELTPKQMAENIYRRALVALQEGRVSVALADLDKALEIDPRNDAARQTYVSLLLENRRSDEAIRQLRLGLGIDPRQPGLAMVLARLQLEKGGPALQTLLKTLPYAGDNPDYHAFLAGVLQREQRHAEAAQHYRDALRAAPQNGVWWMGLAISLQADQHLPEAREAFTRARASGGLMPELQAFVDRKLEQLAR